MLYASSYIIDEMQLFGEPKAVQRPLNHQGFSLSTAQEEEAMETLLLPKHIS